MRADDDVGAVARDDACRSRRRRRSRSAPFCRSRGRDDEGVVAGAAVHLVVAAAAVDEVGVVAAGDDVIAPEAEDRPGLPGLRGRHAQHRRVRAVLVVRCAEQDVERLERPADLYGHREVLPALRGEIDAAGAQRPVEPGTGHEGGDLRQERRVPGLRPGQRDDQLVVGPGAAVVGDVAVGRDRGLHRVVAEADLDARDVLELGPGKIPDIVAAGGAGDGHVRVAAAVDDVDAAGPAVGRCNAYLRAVVLGDDLVQRACGVAGEAVEPAVVGRGDQEAGVLGAEMEAVVALAAAIGLAAGGVAQVRGVDGVVAVAGRDLGDADELRLRQIPGVVAAGRADDGNVRLAVAVDNVDAVGPAEAGPDADLRAGGLRDQPVRRAAGIAAERVEPAVVGRRDPQRRVPPRRDGTRRSRLLRDRPGRR